MEWRQSIIIPMWKRNGDIRGFSQYRVISLLSQPSKVFARMLEKRIRYILEPQLSDNQFGFRKNNGCSDSIFILRQLQEKRIDRNKPLNMAFIDQEKAFDWVVRAELWKCLPERDIFGELLRAVQSLYICSQAAVRTTKGETDLFGVKCGWRQGCVLSPSLFIICMDNIMKRANQEEDSIEELMFADDLVLIAEDQSILQEMVSNLDQQCKNYGMRISRDKTEVMVTSREPIQCDIELDGETLKQVEQFRYLGSIFVREGDAKRMSKQDAYRLHRSFTNFQLYLGTKKSPWRPRHRS